MAGIAALESYIPRYVITAEAYRTGAGRFEAPGIREKSVRGFDEDEITMAVEAGGLALVAAGMPRADQLAFVNSGKTAGAALVAEALGLDPATAKDILGSRDGGETILAGAIDAAAKTGTSTLLVLSNAPGADAGHPEEDSVGAASAGVIVTASGTLPWDRWGKGDAILARTGDTGAVSPLLAFLAANPSLAKEERNLARALDARVPVTYAQYLAMKRHGISPPGTEYSQGAFVSMPAYLTEKKARYRLTGERCTACGRLHFPPRESCLACGARSWEDVALKRTGKVYSYTVIGKGAAPSEFLEQQLAVGEYATAVVELDDGPRVAAMLTDVEPSAVRIGMPVRMVFRRLYTQEGVTRYGFKFAPA